MSKTDPTHPAPRGGTRWAGRLALASMLLAALVAPPALAAIDPDDLLPVDEAFVLTAKANSADAIAIRWQVAEGYYLYRHRIAVSADAGYVAEPLQLPKGKAYRDEFFGDVETYRGALTAKLPGVAKAARTTLTIKYQGCADVGICYPPQTRRIEVVLPSSTPPNAPVVAFGNAAGVAAGKTGNPLLPGAASAATDRLPLPPEQAFGFEAIAGDGNTLLLRFTPARGYYLYRDKTTLTLDADGITPGRPRWPAGTPHKDGYFGKVVVYFDQIDVPLPLKRTRTGAQTVTLTAGFQGCQTDGICYPPMTRTVSVALPAGTLTATSAAPPANDGTVPAAPGAAEATYPGLATTAPASATAPDAMAPDSQDPAAGATSSQSDTRDDPATTAAPAGNQADDSRLAAALSGPDRWWALLSFFGFGLLLAFTPCVLPMIPILSGLIAGHGPGLTSRRAFALSFVYVLANALVFTVAGVVAGLVGANLQIAFQTPWVIVAFALLFVALALSSFGFYELQLPSALRSRLGALTDHQRGGSWTGVAVMGALSALIVGPCVAPPLAAAVLYIGQTKDPAFGGAALFLLAMGMGAPLIAFGVAAGRGLPTTGPWMLAVQRVFGLVFLGLAVWMLSRILPGPVTLALWGVLMIGGAVMFATIANRQAGREAPRTLGWTAAVLMGVAGVAQLLGAMAGSSDPLRPLAGLRGEAASARELPFRKIKSLADLDREIAAARASGQPLMLDFYADWCVACKEMEKYTFPDPAVHAALEGFVLLKVDVTANDAVDQALMRQLGIIGPPATLYYVDGAERRDLRLFGFEKAAPFVERAQRVGTPAR